MQGERDFEVEWPGSQGWIACVIMHGSIKTYSALVGSMSALSRGVLHTAYLMSHSCR